VVQAVEHLHDDALHSQVVSPDLLDQFRVVATFHEDP
jgi:hypothetical protein